MANEEESQRQLLEDSLRRTALIFEEADANKSGKIDTFEERAQLIALGKTMTTPEGEDIFPNAYCANDMLIAHFQQELIERFVGDMAANREAHEILKGKAHDAEFLRREIDALRQTDAATQERDVMVLDLVDKGLDRLFLKDPAFKQRLQQLPEIVESDAGELKSGLPDICAKIRDNEAAKSK